MYALLTPAEAAYFYLGIAIQSLVSGALGVFVAPIILINLLILLSRSIGTGSIRTLWEPLSYLVTSLIIVALFLPGSFGFSGGVAIPATSVTSAAATSGGGAIQNASQSPIVSGLGAGTGASLPFGSNLILQAATDTTLALAQQLSGTALRPFGPVLPMKWLNDTQLSGELIAGARDFTGACYTPAIAKLAATGTVTNLGYQEMLPWGGVLGPQLSSISVVPGIGTGLTGMVTAFFTSGGNLITCAQYATTLSAQATAFVQTKLTAAGTPLTTVWQAELGWAPIEVARLLLFKEIMEAAGPSVPSPSLTGSYLGVKAGAIAGRILQGALGANLPGAGAAPAAAAAGVGEIARVFEGIAGFIRPALFIIWVAPYALGILNLILVGFGPIVFLAALIPGAQFRIIIGYFALIALTTATHLWWALVELGAQTAADFTRYGILTDPIGLAGAQLRYLAITVVGVPLVFFALLTIVGYAGVRLRRNIF